MAKRRKKHRRKSRRKTSWRRKGHPYAGMRRKRKHKAKRHRGRKSSMRFIRSQGFKTRKAYEKALRNIARVNEAFMTGPLSSGKFR